MKKLKRIIDVLLALWTTIRLPTKHTLRILNNIKILSQYSLKKNGFISKLENLSTMGTSD